jgi:hypothetical protein
MMAVFARGSRGERRVLPDAYKLLLTTHIMTSVGWLGVASAKLALGLLALTSGRPEAAQLTVGMDALNVVFPPLAIGATATGVVLSIGTRWGLLAHYWVALKLVLTFGVISTAVQIGGRLGQQAAAGELTAVMGDERVLLVALTAAHVIMLVTASVVSVYKPWGRTWLARR